MLLVPSGDILFAIAPSVNVSKVNAFVVPVPATPPAKVIWVEKLEADPVDNVDPLKAVPTADPDNPNTAPALEAENKEEIFALISSLKLAAVPVALEPVEKKYKFPSASSSGIGFPEATNLCVTPLCIILASSPSAKAAAKVALPVALAPPVTLTLFKIVVLVAGV